MNDQYKATDGSIWHLSPDYPPIPSRSYDWSATHEDYDGPGDDRAVHGESCKDVIGAIEDYIEAGE